MSTKYNSLSPPHYYVMQNLFSFFFRSPSHGCAHLIVCMLSTSVVCLSVCPGARSLNPDAASAPLALCLPSNLLRCVSLPDVTSHLLPVVLSEKPLSYLSVICFSALPFKEFHMNIYIGQLIHSRIGSTKLKLNCLKTFRWYTVSRIHCRLCSLNSHGATVGRLGLLILLCKYSDPLYIHSSNACSK